MILFLILSMVVVNARHTQRHLKDKLISLGPINVTSSSGILEIPYPLSDADIEASRNAAYMEDTARKLVNIPEIIAKDELEPIYLDALNASLLLSNLVVKGIDKLKLRNVTIRLYDEKTNREALRADVILAIPVIDLNVDYVASQHEKQVATGHLTAQLINITLKVVVQIKATMVYFINIFQVDSYSQEAKADDLKVSLRIDQYPELGKNKKYLRTLIDHSKEEIAEYACKFAVKEGNKLLENMPQSMLMELLVPSPTILKSIFDEIF